MITEILLLAPEIVLLTMACVILVLDTVGEEADRAITYWLTPGLSGRGGIPVSVVLPVDGNNCL